MSLWKDMSPPLGSMEQDSCYNIQPWKGKMEVLSLGDVGSNFNRGHDSSFQMAQEKFVWGVVAGKHR